MKHIILSLALFMGFTAAAVEDDASVYATYYVKVVGQSKQAKVRIIVGSCSTSLVSTLGTTGSLEYFYFYPSRSAAAAACAKLEQGPATIGNVFSNTYTSSCGYMHGVNGRIMRA